MSGFTRRELKPLPDTYTVIDLYPNPIVKPYKP
jgi:hypothetical protein